MSDNAEGVLVDVIRGVWAAEEFNVLCPENPISLPVSEVELKQILLEASGVDIVQELASTSFSDDMNLREHAKTVVRGYLEDGCNSDLAKSIRKEVVENLAKIELLYEKD